MRYLDNKKQKAVFLVVFYFAFEHRFSLRARSGAQVNMRAQKVGRLERNMSTPDVQYLQNVVFSFVVKITPSKIPTTR